MRHLLISYHTCPSELPGRDLAGGMNVLLRGFLRATHWETDIVTRSFGGYERLEIRPGVTLHRLPCAATRPWTREKAWECLDAFGTSLQTWMQDRLPYSAVTAHYWMSAALLPKISCEGKAGIVFHTLQAQKGEPQCALEEQRLQWESRLIARYPTAYLHWHDLHNARKHYPELRGTVIRPGTEFTHPTPPPKEGPPWVFGWAARNDPIKNLDEALIWVEQQRQQGLDYRLLVAGMSGANRDWLQYLGPLEPEEMPEFYSCIHQLLNLSRYETFGLSVLEALACGTSVGVRSDSDWARRLRRLGLPWQPGRFLAKTEQAASRRLAQAYLWKRALKSWERWLCSLAGNGG